MIPVPSPSAKWFLVPLARGWRLRVGQRSEGEGEGEGGRRGWSRKHQIKYPVSVCSRFNGKYSPSGKIASVLQGRGQGEQAQS